MKNENVYAYELSGKLYLNLTNKCCNACSFCIRNNADGIKGNRLWLSKEPTASEVLQQIQAVDFAYDEAVFCGYGEPTYALGVLKEVALFLRKNGKTVRINTNGLGNLINKRSIVADLKACVDCVSVSLNAASAEGYNTLCKPIFGAAAYDEIWTFARACVVAGLKTVMTAVDVLPDEELEFCRIKAEQDSIEFRVRHHIQNNESYT